MGWRDLLRVGSGGAHAAVAALSLLLPFSAPSLLCIELQNEIRGVMVFSLALVWINSCSGLITNHFQALFSIFVAKQKAIAATPRGVRLCFLPWIQ